MRVTSVLKKLLGLCASVVICGFELVEAEVREQSSSSGSAASRGRRVAVVVVGRGPVVRQRRRDAHLAPCRRGLCHERARLGCAPR